MVTDTLAALRGVCAGGGGVDPCQSILGSIKSDSIEILASLADGYNRFYAADKAKCYIRARTCVCRVQCFLLLAAGLELLDQKTAEALCKRYEEKLKMFNGLIKLFENVR